MQLLVVVTGSGYWYSPVVTGTHQQPVAVTGTHTLKEARLVKVFVINLEKDKTLCYRQKIIAMFKVLQKVL